MDNNQLLYAPALHPSIIIMNSAKIEITPSPKNALRATTCPHEQYVQACGAASPYLNVLPKMTV